MKKIIYIAILLFSMNIFSQEKIYFIYQENHKLLKINNKIGFTKDELKDAMEYVKSDKCYIQEYYKGATIECMYIREKRTRKFYKTLIV